MGRARLSDLSPAFRAELEAIFADLAAKLGRPAFALELDASSPRVRFDGRTLLVPVKYEIHWRRFGTVATDLVREAAYLASAHANPLLDEADRQVLAEVFVRDRLLSHD